MKRVDEIKTARQNRMFDRRMEAHKGKKRKDLENELMKHLDLIEDPAIKEYIIKKKTEKAEIRKARTEKRSGVHNKMAMAMDSDLEMESDSEEEEPVKQVAKVSTRSQAKIKNKAIKK